MSFMISMSSSASIAVLGLSSTLILLVGIISVSFGASTGFCNKYYSHDMIENEVK